MRTKKRENEVYLDDSFDVSQRISVVHVARVMNMRTQSNLFTFNVFHFVCDRANDCERASACDETRCGRSSNINWPRCGSSESTVRSRPSLCVWSIPDSRQILVTNIMDLKNRVKFNQLIKDKINERISKRKTLKQELLRLNSVRVDIECQINEQHQKLYLASSLGWMLLLKFSWTIFHFSWASVWMIQSTMKKWINCRRRTNNLRAVVNNRLQVWVSMLSINLFFKQLFSFLLARFASTTGRGSRRNQNNFFGIQQNALIQWLN